MKREAPDKIKSRLEALSDERIAILSKRTVGEKTGSGAVSYLDAENIHGNSGFTALEKFEEYQRITDEMNALRLNLEWYVKKIERLEEKVLFLVNVYGMNLREVAEYLGYSHQYVRKIYSDRKKIKDATLLSTLGKEKTVEI
ncbi:MAG: hypothetical protein RSC97_08495 [Eubacterium sp.]